MIELNKVDNNFANKIFDEAKTENEEVVTILYGKDKSEIKFTPHPSIPVLSYIVKIVADVAISDGFYDPIKKDMVLASEIIDLLTDLPVPQIITADDEVIDFQACYNLVYGKNGICNDEKVIPFLQMIDEMILEYLEDKRADLSGVNVLSNRLMEIISVIVKALDNVLTDENISALTDYLEAMVDENTEL